MDAVGMPFVHRGVVGGRVAERDEIEGDEGVGNVEEPAHGRDPFFMRIEAGPHSAQTDGMGGKKDVFGGCREILFPEDVVGSFKESLFIAADHDGCGCVCRHFRVWQRVGELLQQVRVVDYDKFPGLSVHGARRAHGGVEDGRYMVVGDGKVGVASYADPAEDAHVGFVIRELLRD